MPSSGPVALPTTTLPAYTQPPAPAWVQPPPTQPTLSLASLQQAPKQLPGYSAALPVPARMGAHSPTPASPFDRLVSPPATVPAAKAGPPLPTFIGNIDTERDTTITDRLHSALAMAGRGLLLQVENRAAQLLTLRECDAVRGSWQLPPPSGIEAQSAVYFGAISSAGDITGTATFVDAARRGYTLEWTTEGGGARANISALDDGDKPMHGAPPVPEPLAVTWRPGTAGAHELPLLTFVLGSA
eukprot:COSAG04_NODE_7625_length_1096_cov_0.748245_2_plen_243_part_00